MEELNSFVLAEAANRKFAKEKTKNSRMLINLLVLLQQNISQLNPTLYFSVLETLNTDVVNEPRMVSVARLLHH